MGNWREAILKEFVHGVSKLTLVADPDGLLLEEKLSIELRQRGFDLIEFYDHIEFRYAYETNYRTLWDQGKATDLVVILRSHNSDLNNLPFDLLQSGRQLGFNLGDLFPNLSYPVIEELEYKHLDILFEAQGKMSNPLGDNDTKDFILRNVFKVAAELIHTPVELIRCLLRCHYSNLEIPNVLLQRMVQVLQQCEVFKGWPLNDIVSDSEAFFLFLQERWPLFLESIHKPSAGNILGEAPAEYNLIFPGPVLLPFDHQDIKIYIDNLFLEGKLIPVESTVSFDNQHEWIKCGVISNSSGESILRTERLYGKIHGSIPGEDSRYSDWLYFSSKWAELKSLCARVDCGDKKEKIHQLGEEINNSFAKWLPGHYASLINLPPMSPAMVHHVARSLAREAENSEKIALIVVDGLSLDQWVTARQILKEQDETLIMRESASFAWIPTITSVSRQAIFAGKAPVYFPASIAQTDKEKKLWQQFWEGNGFSKMEVVYGKGLGEGDIEDVLAQIHPTQTKIAGLVVDTVDKIMHGMQLGTEGMHNQLEQWCRKGFLCSLISKLLDNNFQVWLTSDHGNIECIGKGHPAEGAIAKTRGERVRIYPTEELREKVASEFALDIKWPPIGLPSAYYPLVANKDTAFIQENKTTVSHGGISIEEVIVPLVKFERRGQ